MTFGVGVFAARRKDCDAMAYTPDEVALAIIAEGQTARTEGTPETLHPVISPRGIQIAQSTAIVESNDRVLANPNVPESENYPNDGDGYDHDSTGEMQQQPQWWGTVAEEMDPRLSAAMFYHALCNLPNDYNDPNTSPGTFAQDVQGSAFPDRYDEHFQEAVDQYNRLVAQPSAPEATPVSNVTAAPRPDFNEYPLWSPNCEPRDGTTIDLWLWHTEEGNIDDPNAADDLTRGDLDNPARQVSYNYAGSENEDDHGVTIIDVVPLDQASWSVLSANHRSIDFCIAGSTVNWTREEWFAKASKVIDVGCYISVRDCLANPTILFNGAPRVIAPDPNNTNVYHSDPPGISDHKYVTEYLGDGSHSDMGPNFIWDYVEERTAYWWSVLSGQPAPAPAPAPVSSQTYSVESGDSIDGIAQQFGISDDALLAANPSVTDPDLIYPGQILVIPSN